MNISVESEWGDMTFDFSNGLRFHGFPSFTFDFLCATDWFFISKVIHKHREDIEDIYREYGNHLINRDRFIELLREVFPERYFWNGGIYFDALMILILEADEFASCFKNSLSTIRQGGNKPAASLNRQQDIAMYAPVRISSAVAFLEKALVLNNKGIYVYPHKAQNSPLLFSNKTYRLVTASQVPSSDEHIMMNMLSYVIDQLRVDNDFKEFIDSAMDNFQFSHEMTPFETRNYIYQMFARLRRITASWCYPDSPSVEKDFLASLGDLHSILTCWNTHIRDTWDNFTKLNMVEWAMRLCDAAMRKETFFDLPQAGTAGPECQLQIAALDHVRQNKVWTYELTSIIELLFLMTSLSGQISPNEANVLRPCSCCKRPILSANKSARCLRVFVDPETGIEREDRASCETVFSEKEVVSREEELHAPYYKENRTIVIDKHRQYNDNSRARVAHIEKNLANRNRAIERIREDLIKYAFFYLQNLFLDRVYCLFLQTDIFPPATAKQCAETNFQDWHKKLWSFKKENCQRVLQSSKEERPKICLDLLRPDHLDPALPHCGKACTWCYEHHELAWPDSIITIINEYNTKGTNDTNVQRNIRAQIDTFMEDMSATLTTLETDLSLLSKM